MIYSETLNKLNKSKEHNILLELCYLANREYFFFLREKDKEDKNELMETIKEFNFEFIDKEKLLELVETTWDEPIQIYELIQEACNKYNDWAYDLILHISRSETPRQKEILDKFLVSGRWSFANHYIEQYRDYERELKRRWLV